MLWVVGYAVAAASAVCTVAMAADAVKVFRHKKLWSPCQLFSLNSTSLTLLAIATKLPMDVNGDGEYSVLNLLPKFNGVVFLSTAMANFMSSLGSSEDKDNRTNVAALAILVTTMAVNVLLQVAALYSSGYVMAYIALLYTIFLLLLLATVVSLAVAVPAMKRSLESMYEARHEVVRKGEEALGRMEQLSKNKMMKYWVMAESSSPQFVMARSVVSTNSALLCLLSQATMLTICVLIWISGQRVRNPYGSVTESIFYIQIAGVLVGSIAPMLRWLVVVSFKCSRNYSSVPSPKESKRTLSGADVYKKGFLKIENYWTRTLVDLRDSAPVWEIWDSTCKLRRYFLHFPKRVVLTCCIGLQIFVVLLSKVFISLSALCVTPVFLCYTCIKNFLKKYRCFNEDDDDDDDDGMDLKDCVLLLDGEVELPAGVLRDMCRRANNTIERGRNNQPRHLIDLLEKFIDYRGVETGTVDDVSDEIVDFPNCWTLPVFTLTCIALALPSSNEKRKRLLSSASEGLSLTRLVDDKQNARRVNSRKAAEKIPEMDFDFKRYSHFRSSREVLEALSSKAIAVVQKFNKGSCSKNPLHCPTNVVAAYSMYRITRTILSWPQEKDDERLFEQISAMIADALATSLTNLPDVITTMCHGSAIEKREKNVRKAFLLFGKTQRIVQLVQKKRESLCYDENTTVKVEFWRPLFQEPTNVATEH